MTRPMQITVVAVIAIAVSLSSVAQAAPSSGMLLGVYAFKNWRGLRLTGTIPGYSAHGRLRRNDVLLRVTPNGHDIYSVKSHWQIEQAKEEIGPNRMASLEVYRPGQGLIYFWVEFQPVGGVVAKSYTAETKVKVMTENERPGARALFQGQGGGSNGQYDGNGSNSNDQSNANGFSGKGSASSLFGR